MRNKFTAVKTAKRRNKSSMAWLKRQINDPFVKQAQEQGFRSRSAFKIIEINDKFKIFKKGKIVLDLGATPGGWSQVAVEKVGKGRVFAVDVLDMDMIDGVSFLKQDFLAPDSIKNITNLLNHNHSKNDRPLQKLAFGEKLDDGAEHITAVHTDICDDSSDAPNKQLPLKVESNTRESKKCDIVLSDMAENTCGDSGTDHLRIVGLLEEVLDFACQILVKDGVFVGKIFQGGASGDLLQKFRQKFSVVKHFKPNSSRKESTESYIVAIGFKIGNVIS